jgi:hypothetical protein
MCRAWGTSMGWLRPSYSRLSLVLGGPHNNQQPANQDLAGAIPARARRQRHGKPPNPRLAHAAVHSASTLRPTPHPSQGVDPALATLPRHFVPSNRLRLMIFGDFLPHHLTALICQPDFWPPYLKFPARVLRCPIFHVKLGSSLIEFIKFIQAGFPTRSKDGSSLQCPTRHSLRVSAHLIRPSSSFGAVNLPFHTNSAVMHLHTYTTKHPSLIAL